MNRRPPADRKRHRLMAGLLASRALSDHFEPVGLSATHCLSCPRSANPKVVRRDELAVDELVVDRKSGRTRNIGGNALLLRCLAPASERNCTRAAV